MQTVKMISDSQFESMGLAIGQIAKIKALMLSENKGAEISKGLSMYVNVWRRSSLMVSALVHGSSGPGSSPDWGHCVVFLGKTLHSQSAFLHPGVKMGTLYCFNHAVAYESSFL